MLIQWLRISMSYMVSGNVPSFCRQSYCQCRISRDTQKVQSKNEFARVLYTRYAFPMRSILEKEKNPIFARNQPLDKPKFYHTIAPKSSHPLNFQPCNQPQTMLKTDSKNALKKKEHQTQIQTSRHQQAGAGSRWQVGRPRCW